MATKASWILYFFKFMGRMLFKITLFWALPLAEWFLCQEVSEELLASLWSINKNKIQSPWRWRQHFLRNVVTNVSFYTAEERRKALFKLKLFHDICRLMTVNVTFRVATCFVYILVWFETLWLRTCRCQTCTHCARCTKVCSNVVARRAAGTRQGTGVLLILT